MTALGVKRALNHPEHQQSEGPLTARSGRAVLKLATTYEGHERSVIAES
jgi:hypothetical protein